MREQAVQMPRRRTGRWLRACVAAALLVMLLQVGLMSVAYIRNAGTPGGIHGGQAPSDNLLYSPPQFVQSITGIAGPMGVAVASDGTVYAVESGGERMVRLFDSDGKALGAFAAPRAEAGASSPASVAVGPKGDVYVTDRTAQTIYIYGRLGDFVGRVASPPGSGGWQPLGVSFDQDGKIYVTDVTPGKHRVLVLDPDGGLKLAFGKQGSSDGEFSFPSTVAVDRQGRIFVSDGNNGRVQIFDSSGKFLGAIGRGPGQGDLTLPRGIAIDNAAHLLFVVDASRHAVQYYDIGGATPRFVNSFGDSGSVDSALAFPAGIAVDERGHVFVADRENNRVVEWRY